MFYLPYAFYSILIKRAMEKKIIEDRLGVELVHQLPLVTELPGRHGNTLPTRHC